MLNVRSFFDRSTGRPAPQPRRRPPFFKRRLIVHRLQLGLMAIVGISAITASFLTVFLIVIYLGDHEEWALDRTRMIFTIICAIVFTTCGFVMVTFFTNRIFGPLYRLHVEIQKRIRGEASGPIQVRSGDYFIDLVADFNKLYEKLSNDRRD